MCTHLDWRARELSVDLGTNVAKVNPTRSGSRLVCHALFSAPSSHRSRSRSVTACRKLFCVRCPSVSAVESQRAFRDGVAKASATASPARLRSSVPVWRMRSLRQLSILGQELRIEIKSRSLKAVRVTLGRIRFLAPKPAHPILTYPPKTISRERTSDAIHYREGGIATRLKVKVCECGFEVKAVVDWYPRLVPRLVASVGAESSRRPAFVGIVNFGWVVAFLSRRQLTSKVSLKPNLKRLDDGVPSQSSPTNLRQKIERPTRTELPRPGTNRIRSGLRQPTAGPETDRSKTKAR